LKGVTARIKRNRTGLEVHRFSHQSANQMPSHSHTKKGCSGVVNLWI